VAVVCHPLQVVQCRLLLHPLLLLFLLLPC
jgi:hypothetical protein